MLSALENEPVDSHKVMKTYQGICDAIAAEEAGGFSFRELTKGGKTQNFRRTMLGILAQCFQQISGIKFVFPA